MEVDLQASSQALQMLLSTPTMMQQLHASLGAGVRAHVRPERDAAGLRPVRLSGDAARVHSVRLLVQACEVRRGRPAAPCTPLHALLPPSPLPLSPPSSAADLAPPHPSRAPLSPSRAAWAVPTQAHARAARERPEHLSASEALHAYYGPFYEAAGLPYVEPRRLWHDQVTRTPPLAPTVTLARTLPLASPLPLHPHPHTHPHPIRREQVDAEAARFEQWKDYYSSMGAPLPGVPSPATLASTATGPAPAHAADAAHAAHDAHAAHAARAAHAAHATAAAAAALPAGWRELRDASGGAYYCHAESQTTQWRRPEAAPDAVEAAPDAHGGVAASAAAGAVADAAASVAASAAELLAEGWSAMQAADGRTYYVSASGVTQWRRPPVESDEAAAVPMEAAPMEAMPTEAASLEAAAPMEAVEAAVPMESVAAAVAAVAAVEAVEAVAAVEAVEAVAAAPGGVGEAAAAVSVWG